MGYIYQYILCLKLKLRTLKSIKYFKATIHPIHVKILSMKITIFYNENLMKRVALFYNFANLFNGWLNRRKPGYHFYFCIQSVAISSLLMKLCMLAFSN